MLTLNKLNNLDYIRAKQSALIIARRTATPAEQRTINIELDIIYNAKYKVLKELNNGNSN